MLNAEQTAKVRSKEGAGTVRSLLSDRSRYPRVMGILNITPDSFSDGGQFTTIESALNAARGMAAAGVDLIDIGGESTRPGSKGISEGEQIDRVAPVIAAIQAELTIPISIDTTRAAVAAAALDAGACLVNDISAGIDDPAMLPLVVRRQVPIILMHMQGSPATMQDNPSYADVVAEVGKFLFERAGYAQTAGVDPADILIDPGIGFGKTVEHNLKLMQGLAGLASLGLPMVVGTSRKGFIGQITGESDPADRVFGTAATVAWAAANGAALVRVHDVAAMIKVVSMIRAIRNVGTGFDSRTRGTAI